MRRGCPSTAACWATWSSRCHGHNETPSGASKLASARLACCPPSSLTWLRVSGPWLQYNDHQHHQLAAVLAGTLPAMQRLRSLELPMALATSPPRSGDTAASLPTLATLSQLTDLRAVYDLENKDQAATVMMSLIHLSPVHLRRLLELTGRHSL